MNKLYAGLQRDDKYYNHFQLKEIEGGLRKALNIKEPTMARIIFKFTKASIQEIFTESGEPYKLTNDDYGQLVFENAFAIGRASQKFYTGEQKPIFDEYIECKICSSGKGKHFVHVRESWDDLINKGHIVETYLESDKDRKWSCTLEDGLDIGKSTFKTLNFELSTYDKMIDITDNPDFETSIDYANARSDYELVSIDGMSEKDFNMARRVAKDGGFLARYVKSDKDWDIISNSRPMVGINTEHRVVKCDKCRNRLMGDDMKNFFFFLTIGTNRDGLTAKS